MRRRFAIGVGGVLLFGAALAILWWPSGRDTVSLADGPGDGAGPAAPPEAAGGALAGHGAARRGPPSASPVPEPSRPAPTVPRVPSARGSVRVTLYGEGAREDDAALEVEVVGSDGVARRARVVAGKAVVTDVPPGAVQATLTAPGFVDAAAVGRVPDDGTVEELGLRWRPGAAITGRVVAAATGAPVAGARVRVLDGGGFGGTWSQEGVSITAPVASDDDGRFRTPTVGFDDVVTVEVVAEGYARARVPTRLQRSTDDRPPIVVALEPGGSVVGRVVRAGGLPAAGVAVYVFGATWDDQRRNPAEPTWDDMSTEPPQRSHEATTDGDGRFAVHGVPLGLPWCATAIAAGGLRAPDVCGPSLAATPPAPITLALPSPAVLEVLVLDPSRRPAPHVAVEVSDREGRSTTTEATGEDGIARFSTLSAGVHKVELRPEGFVPVEVPVRLGTAAVARETVILDRGAVIAGTVVDDEGAPVVGVPVSAERTEGQARLGAHTQTDASGAFRLVGVARAAHRVSASAWDQGRSEPVTVRAPTEALRLVMHRVARCILQLVVPPGAVAPRTVRCWNGDAERGGGAGSGATAFGNGRVESRGPAGRRRLLVHAEGFAPLEVFADVPMSGTVDLGTVTLDPGVVVEGVVTDREDRPVAGAEVAVYEHEGAAVQVGADGRFRFEHVRRGDVTLQASARDFLDTWDPRTVPSPTTAIRVVLARGALVRGRLRDIGGRAVPVRLEDGTGRLGRETTTDESGRFAVRVPPGTYAVQAGPSDRPTVLGTVEAVEGATLDLGELVR